MLPGNLKGIKWFKFMRWLPNASVLIFFSSFGECCLIMSTFSSQSQSKGSRPLDVWSVLMEDFTAHWALMSWSLLIREQLSGTLTSGPINRPGLVHDVAVGARKCHQSDKEKNQILVDEFPGLGILGYAQLSLFMVERKLEKASKLCVLLFLSLCFTSRCRNIINKRVPQIRFHGSTVG